MFSDPVVGNKFFGRSQILDLISKRVEGLKDGYRQNIAIIGPKLIGKSSLILHSLANFKYPGIIPIYIDLRPKSFNHFIYNFLGAVLYHFLKKNKNLKVAVDLETLKKYAQEYIPKTVRTIQSTENSLKSSQFDKAYETLLNLTFVLKQEADILSIVILDEFHFLNTYKIKNPFARFAREIMTQKDTMYILISSQINRAKSILANELFLLFGNFEAIHLKPFDYFTSCKFLENRFHGIQLPHNLRNFLINFSEGHPFYLDILSNKLVEKAKELNKKVLTHILISQVFNSLIYDSKGILNQYFTSLFNYNFNGCDHSSFAPILLSVSKRGCNFKDICEITNCQPKKTSKLINYLIDKDLLNKVGVFYRVQDKMFRFWLKSVYYRKSLSLTADPTTESNNFCKEIEEQILQFSTESKKILTERIIELFRSFRNEIIMLQNKLVKFWHFEEVYPVSCGQLQDCIIARSQASCWACWIAKEQISESQVQEFFLYCKKSKQRIRKVIIIALKDLNLNVKLMALEKRIWIWSLSDLNLIIDLYGKQQMVR